MGAPGSGGERVAHKILSHFGLDYENVKAEFMTNTEMVAALKDGTLDAFIITHPLKSAALLDLTTTLKVRMIEVGDDEFYQKYPYFTKQEIKAGTYKGVNTPVSVPTSRVVMYTCTKAGLSTDDVCRMLRGIWENSDEWNKTHPAVKHYTTLEDALKGVNIPLHPGAVKYYREKGLNIPEELLK